MRKNMAVVDVLSSAGEKVSEVQLSDDIFNTTIKTDILHLVVRSQLLARRKGTASSKNRGAVSGSTRKLFRQKGTGNARAGSIKSPLRRGGGTIFGPAPRSYDIKVPKKLRKLALQMALSSKLEDRKLFVIDRFNLETIRTKAFINILKALSLSNLLIISDSDDTELLLSARNVPDVKIIKTDGLNVYDILKYKNLLIVEHSINNIERRLS
jgi:large subunit ribosomal protein L4